MASCNCSDSLELYHEDCVQKIADQMTQMCQRAAQRTQAEPSTYARGFSWKKPNPSGASSIHAKQPRCPFPFQHCCLHMCLQEHEEHADIEKEEKKTF